MTMQSQAALILSDFLLPLGHTAGNRSAKVQGDESKGKTYLTGLLLVEGRRGE